MWSTNISDINTFITCRQSMIQHSCGISFMQPCNITFVKGGISWPKRGWCCDSCGISFMQSCSITLVKGESHGSSCWNWETPMVMSQLYNVTFLEMFEISVIYGIFWNCRIFLKFPKLSEMFYFAINFQHVQTSKFCIQNIIIIK